MTEIEQQQQEAARKRAEIVADAVRADEANQECIRQIEVERAAGVTRQRRGSASICRMQTLTPALRWR